jgi:hypothetical protein
MWTYTNFGRASLLENSTTQYDIHLVKNDCIEKINTCRQEKCIFDRMATVRSTQNVLTKFLCVCLKQ